MSNHRNMMSYPGTCCARCSPLLQRPTHDTRHAGTRSRSETEPKCPIVRRHWRCVRGESILPFKPLPQPPPSLLQPRPGVKPRRRICIHGNGKKTFTFIHVVDTFIQNGDRKRFKRTAELMWVKGPAVVPIPAPPSPFNTKYQNIQHAYVRSLTDAGLVVLTSTLDCSPPVQSRWAWPKSLISTLACHLSV